MRQEQRAIAKYVNAATDLADQIKADIQHGGKIRNDTILKLNDFRIAANAVADFIDAINKKALPYDN